MGTSDFAVPVLKALHSQHNVAAAVTQPDRPKGRSGKPVPPPVKESALRLGITVLQPENARKKAFADTLRGYEADLFVVASYGQILTERVLQIPAKGCINVHASLLPKYRGASPIQSAIINGETVTGITTMLMDKGIDTGDMLLNNELPISPDDTAQTLHDKLALLGAKTLTETLKLLENGRLVPIPQNHSEATHAPIITKEAGHIKWDCSPNKIVNTVRGLNPWPCAYVLHDGTVIKVWKAEFAANINITPDAVHGQVLCADKSGLYVCAGGGAVRLTVLQPPNGKAMPDTDFIRGRQIKAGAVFI
jgi:methionyl-tRNA formyltransferase